ncbi:MAG: hypothetical protein ACI9XO_000858 [Paraglaciecola sp.]|jgi:hypothetical protein
MGNFLNINLTAEEDQKIEVAVYNTGNQLVTKFKVDLENGLNRETLATADFAKGFYTMVVSNHQKMKVMRFSKN